MAFDSNSSRPVNQVWRDGLAVSQRRSISVGPLTLESGFVLPDVVVAYETYGTFTGDNAVLIEHALTGDSHVSGLGAESDQPGWWDELVGPGKSVDTNEWFVICANVLGGCQGTTGPSSLNPIDELPWGDRWPRITVRDQVALEALLVDALDISKLAAILGGSMGGMRALEWLIMHPERVGSALLLATTAQASADQIGTQTVQISAITNDPQWHDGNYHAQGDGLGPQRGLAIARQIAHLSYRTEVELAQRFGLSAQADEDPYGNAIFGLHPGAGRFAVQSYLEHHGDKLVRRFDAGSYVSLTDVMNTHDVSRGRDSLQNVLAHISVPVVVGGIATDRLYPISQQAQLAELIPTAQGLETIESIFGHDGFLIEVSQVGELVEKTLRLARH
jgi:homoserine O-acetyltransferase